jgi:branched-chain amino acid transport system substrate-binding protein
MSSLGATSREARMAMRRIVLPAVMTLLATIGAADAAETPRCGASTGSPAAGPPIAIGAIVSRTGRNNYDSAARAAAAYFKCVNANGGINGRPIDYMVEDDMWSPETSAQAANKLINDRKVVALIGDGSYFACRAGGTVIQDADVISIPGLGIPRECFMSRNIAPMNAGPRVSATGAAMFAHKVLGAKRIVYASPRLPGVEWGASGAMKYGKQAGLDMIETHFDVGSADSTSIMLQIANMKPDAVVISVPKETTIPLLQAAEEQDLGTRIKFLNTASAYDLSVPRAIGPYWNNRWYLNLEFGPIDGSGPDTVNWRAVIDRFGNKEDPRDTQSQGGYLAARLATETLSRLDPARIDRAAVTAALRAVTDFKSDMLCGSWSFEGADATRHNPNHGGPNAVASDGAFKVVGSCIDALLPD